MTKLKDVDQDSIYLTIGGVEVACSGVFVLESRTLDQTKDELIGKKGTKKRDAYEKKLAKKLSKKSK